MGRSGRTTTRDFAVASGVYVVLATIGYLLADSFLTADGVSVWYPPAACTFTYLAIVGPRGAPVALATRLAASAVLMADTFSLGNAAVTGTLVVASYTAAAAVYRRALGDSPRDRRGVVAFVVTGFGAALGAATTSMTASALLGRLPADRLPAAIEGFALGDASAILTLAPLALLVGWERLRRPPRPGRPRDVVEAVLVAVALGGAAVLTRTPDSGRSQLYLLFVPLAWVVLRHGLAAATSVIAATGMLVPLLTLTTDTSSTAMAGIQLFIVVVALTGLVLGAAESDRREDRDAVIRVERRFRAAFEDAPYGVELATATGVIDVNRRLLELTGRTREELLGGGVAPFLHPDDRERIIADRLASEARDEKVFSTEARLVRPDGHEVWIRGTVVTVEGDLGISRIIHVADITEQHLAGLAIAESRSRLEWQAYHDALTGLPNRLLLLDRVADALDRARAGGRLVAALYIDLDRFKLVNDTLGHATGDRLLAVVATKLTDLLDGRGTVARLGGDEFVVLLDDLERSEQGVELAERITTALQDPIRLGGTSVSAAASIGIAFATDGAPEALLRDADTALYRAKERGKNRHEVFDDSLRAAALRKVAAEHLLRQALDEQQLVVHYQPVVDLLTGQLLGAEALLRVPAANGDLQSPVEFIGVADETGLIVPIGAGILDAACSALTGWRSQGSGIGHVAVNVSARQLSTPGFADVVETALERHGLGAHELVLELTESALIHADPQTTRAINRLHDIGVGLAIDDFGTGYGSLSYLKRFPVKSVKIDRSFVAGLGVDGNDTEIVRAITSLGRSLGLLVVAEGIETREQLERLRDLGCDAGQGYLFAPPLDRAALPASDHRPLLPTA